MTSIKFDTSELDALVSDLRRVDTEVKRKVEPVMKKGALNVKTQWAADAAGSRHFRIAPYVNFDIKGGLGAIEAEIGIDKRGAGNLGNIAHFGGANGGGGTLSDPTTYLNAEEPRFMSALADIFDGLL